MKGQNPDWANLARRKCDDCGKSYKPARPLREGERGFCMPTCRKSYHKHGGAYRKLKVEMGKEIERQMRKLQEVIREIVIQEIGSIVTAANFRDVTSSAQLRQISKSTPVPPPNR
jgi:hydrogenase maturation factor HypF (carbamoyltransferase family)